MSTCSIYATIGNSDDKLGQGDWASFAAQFAQAIKIHAQEIHGVWWSAPDAPWQNCCVGFAIDEEGIEPLRVALTKLREYYRQDAIAWVRGYPAEMI